VIVTKKCLLIFQIGKFSEKVLCDIVEMDSYHVLLKRPWLFDRIFFHDGKKNTYKFLKDGEWYKFEPMVETKLNGSDRKRNDNINVCSNNHVMMCSVKEFLRE
jgi:hypothetical protein